jgi:hypothetical protein
MGAVAAAVTTGLMLAATVAPSANADTAPAPTDTPAPSQTASPSPSPTDPAPTTPPDEEPPTRPDRQDRLRLPMHKGDSGRYVGVLQDRLTWMGYDVARRELRTKHFGPTTKKAARTFQSKFFLDPSGRVNVRTWKALKSTSEPVGKVPGACKDGVALCVDKTAKILRFMRDGKVILTLDARFGASGTPTREGVFSVFRKSRDHWSSLYGSWMPFAMFFSGGQAVHYSPYFARDGYYGASHGCIGVRDIKAAEWMYDRVPMGARVVVYWS